MTRELIAFCALLIVPTIALLAYSSVRKRRRMQEQQLLPLVQAEEGDPFITCLYVSTVFASDPLVRIWARGLGPRGKAQLILNSISLSIKRVGEEGFSIPASEIEALSTSSATIDKGVERNGLLGIHWTHSNQKLITQLRFSSGESHRKAIDTITTKLGVGFE